MPEPKQTPEQTADAFLDSLDVKGGEEQPQENAQPEIEQPEVKEEGGSDPLKTPSTPDADSFKGVDKGFATHPKWIERENKLKETEARLREFEQAKTGYDELLGDPVVFKRYLERQGLSENRIAEMMRERGFQVEDKKGVDDLDNLVSEVCLARGWNMNSLNADQKAYIKDIIALTDTVFSKRSEKYVGSQLKPIQSYIQGNELKAKTDSEYSQAQEFADKYKFDFDKDLLPALQKQLDDLDAKDPSGTRIKFDVLQWTKDTILELLNEKANSTSRQEERNNLKSNAKPLSPRNSAQKSANSLKGKNASETADKFFESIGFKD